MRQNGILIGVTRRDEIDLNCRANEPRKGRDGRTEGRRAKNGRISFIALEDERQKGFLFEHGARTVNINESFPAFNVLVIKTYTLYMFIFGFGVCVKRSAVYAHQRMLLHFAAAPASFPRE